MQARALSTRQRGQSVDIDLGSAVGPVNIAAPTIAGNPWIGQTLTADHGPWSGTRPMNYAYQWYGNTVAIEGAQQRTFAIPTDDPDYIAAELAVQVRASNSAGAETAMSASVTVTVVPPFFQGVYNINGPMQVGQTVYAFYTVGGTAPITPSFRWFQDSIEVDGEVSNGLLLTEGMLGAPITLEITLTNDAGTAVVTTAARVVLAADPVAPQNIAAPEITGTPNPGEELTVSNGDWTGTEPITFARQWRADSVPIEGATASTYLVPDDPGQVGKMIDAVITASNVVDDVPAAASAVEIVSAGGSYVQATGGTITTDGDFKVHTLVDGQTLSVTVGGDVGYLIVGSGGAGGTQGGAGAGGDVKHGTMTLAIDDYPVVIGAAGTAFFDADGTDGGAASFNGITAPGGGGGGKYSEAGHDGASGGGGGAGGDGGAGGAATGDGNSGGAGLGGGGGGGGGGATAAGVSATDMSGGAGGAGYTSSISGTAQVYGSGGGGGAGGTGTASGGVGGTNAGNGDDIVDGTAQSLATGAADGYGGGGGGGGGWFVASNGGAGGLGTVVIRRRFQN